MADSQKPEYLTCADCGKGVEYGHPDLTYSTVTCDECFAKRKAARPKPEGYQRIYGAYHGIENLPTVKKLAEALKNIDKKMKDQNENMMLQRVIDDADSAMAFFAGCDAEEGIRKLWKFRNTVQAADYMGLEVNLDKITELLMEASREVLRAGCIITKKN